MGRLSRIKIACQPSHPEILPTGSSSCVNEINGITVSHEAHQTQMRRMGDTVLFWSCCAMPQASL